MYCKEFSKRDHPEYEWPFYWEVPVGKDYRWVLWKGDCLEVKIRKEKKGKGYIYLNWNQVSLKSSPRVNLFN